MHVRMCAAGSRRCIWLVSLHRFILNQSQFSITSTGSTGVPLPLCGRG